MRRCLVSLLLFSITLCSFSENNLDILMQRIMDRNVALKKYKAQADAIKASNHTGITLADPEVEFNYLWGAPNDVGQRKDISITQHFDYATIFGLKRREAISKDELADVKYEQACIMVRQEVLTALCTIASLNEKYDEYSTRVANAEMIAKQYKKKMAAGDANKIDVNKTNLNVATLKAELSQIGIDRERAIGATVLSHCIADEEKTFVYAINIDDIQNYVTKSNTTTIQEIEQQKAIKEENAAALELCNAKAASLPELTAGYMSELTRNEKFRGITLGISLPLWSNRGNVAKIRSQLNAIKAEQEETFANINAQRNTLIATLNKTHDMIDMLKENIKSTSNEQMLLKALNEGEISILEYITDNELYYELKDKLIDTRFSQAETLIKLSTLGPAI